MVTAKYNPTLETIKMVEKSLENMEDSQISVAKLKKILPRRIHHYTLRKILEYLEESNKILVTMKGIVWIHNDSPQMKRALEKATPFESISQKKP